MAVAPHPTARRAPRLLRLAPRSSDAHGPGSTAVVRRAFARARSDCVRDAAAATAFYGFTALPSLLLALLGIFVLLGWQNSVDALLSRARGVLPEEAVTLLGQSLTRAARNERGSVALVAVGLVLALWTATGAMAALMRALNVAYGAYETRGTIRRRLAALAMVAFGLLAGALALGVLVLGPVLSRWIGTALDERVLVSWLWWVAEWPVLAGGLLGAFAGLLWLGPDVERRRIRFVSLGSVVAVAAWLAVSGLFALYAGHFGSYNKAWGSLSAVIVTLTWMWLSTLALLFGAEVDAEIERMRSPLRAGASEPEEP